MPTRVFHDLRTGRSFTRPVAACCVDPATRPVLRARDARHRHVDFDKGLGLAHSDALLADAQVVYGSQGSLYVATQKWLDPAVPLDRVPAGQATVIDRFDVGDPDSTPLVGSGEVPGYLLNQFSLSEYGGYLRVATTSRPIWWGEQPSQTLSQSSVTVLSLKGGVLAPVGQVSGLGAGEQIYSVRFVDDVGLRGDVPPGRPALHDRSEHPTAPRVAGKLELSGYSAYLHPVGDGLLLGIGVEVDPASNEPSGTQLELFDVSDPAAPKLLQKALLGSGSSSPVQYDHHAFLFWPPTRLAVLPVQIGGGACRSRRGRRRTTPAQPFVGAIGYRVDRAGIAELGRISHDPVNGLVPPIERSLVIGNRLYTVSAGGVLASSLDSLARQGFAAFPATAPVPTPLPSPVPVPTPLPAPRVGVAPR